VAWGTGGCIEFIEPASFHKEDIKGTGGLFFRLKDESYPQVLQRCQPRPNTTAGFAIDPAKTYTIMMVPKVVTRRIIEASKTASYERLPLVTPKSYLNRAGVSCLNKAKDESEDEDDDEFWVHPGRGSEACSDVPAAAQAPADSAYVPSEGEEDLFGSLGSDPEKEEDFAKNPFPDHYEAPQVRSAQDPRNFEAADEAPQFRSAQDPRNFEAAPSTPAVPNPTTPIFGCDFTTNLKRKGFQWTPLLRLHCVRIMTFLKTANDLQAVCRLAAEITFPAETLPADFEFPSREQLRLDLIKLDMLQMKFQRELIKKQKLTHRTARHVSPDGSPLGRQHFFCVREERMVRRLGFAGMPERGFPFGGFTWVRRIMPLCTYGHKSSHTGTKLFLMSHTAYLEAGEELPTWREQTVGFTSDQARSEKKISDCPFGPVGLGSEGTDALRTRLERLARGTVDIADPLQADVPFLPNALEDAGHQHIIANAIEESLKSVPEWKEYEPRLRAWAYIFGTPDEKETMLEMFAGSERYYRMLIHRFSTRLLEWRWGEVFMILWC
jgi:hypothetical protein